jgi:hypothetical protein
MPLELANLQKGAPKVETLRSGKKVQIHKVG